MNRHTRHFVAVASPTGRTPLDPSSAERRQTADRSRDSAADRGDGHREPDVGVPADPRRACRTRAPRWCVDGVADSQGPGSGTQEHKQKTPDSLHLVTSPDLALDEVNQLFRVHLEAAQVTRYRPNRPRSGDPNPTRPNLQRSWRGTVEALADRCCLGSPGWGRDTDSRLPLPEVEPPE